MQHQHDMPIEVNTNKVKDPVCGMNVDPATAKYNHHLGDTDYYFCGQRCLDKFKASPGDYTRPAKVRASCCQHDHGHEKPTPLAVDTGSMDMIYTCPMHPQIRQPKPGNCPICGMALEPDKVSLNAPPDHELTDMTRRLWISAILSLPLLVINMGAHIWPGMHSFLMTPASAWLQLLLATPVVLWCGWPFFERFWQSLKNKSPNMFTLVGMGIGVAYIYSLIVTLVPQLLAGLMASDAMPQIYFEPAAVITVLVLLGQVMELKARAQTGNAIRALLKLAPDTACKINADGSEQDIPLSQVQVGDALRVRPGEKIPVDGVVLEGASSVDNP